MAREKIYTKAGDDGTTGLFYGGRVRKDSALPAAYGTVDEAQAVIGLARAEAGHTSDLEPVLVAVARDLYVLMAELATAPQNRTKLTPGTTAVTQARSTIASNQALRLPRRAPRAVEWRSSV